jgi:hypothetical protein
MKAPLILPPALFKPSAQQQRFSQFEMGGSHGVIELQCATHAVDGLLDLHAVVLNDAEVVVAKGLVRRQTDRAPRMVQRVFES